jgi:hypothetical protein
MSVIYGNWKIETKPNDFGYFEATNLNDCDAEMILNKTLRGLTIDIDELE